MALPKYFLTTLQEVTLQLFSFHPALLQAAVNSQMNAWDLGDLVIKFNDLGIQVNKSEILGNFSFIPTSGQRNPVTVRQQNRRFCVRRNGDWFDFLTGVRGFPMPSSSLVFYLQNYETEASDLAHEHGLLQILTLPTCK